MCLDLVEPDACLPLPVRRVTLLSLSHRTLDPEKEADTQDDRLPLCATLRQLLSEPFRASRRRRVI